MVHWRVSVSWAVCCGVGVVDMGDGRRSGGRCGKRAGRSVGWDVNNGMRLSGVRISKRASSSSVHNAHQM